MTTAERCFQCGRANPVKYEAIYTPDEGEARRLVICEQCGAQLEADAFAALAMRALPGADGTVEIVNTPGDQARQPAHEAMPENQ